MEGIYVCQYCGNLYGTEEEALDCEEEAKKIKPLFKMGDTVCDDEDYNYKVIKKPKIWKRTKKKWFFNFYYRCIFLGEADVILGSIPTRHCFVYNLVGVDPENEGEKNVLREDELKVE